MLADCQRIALTLTALFLLLIKDVGSIGCFVCHSMNGSDPMCEDGTEDDAESGFNTLMLGNTVGGHQRAKYYQEQCWGYRKDREGLFPADHCIKIDGKHDQNDSYTVMIRTCSLDSGTLTADTEIVRISHCGHFKYGEQYFSGCVQSCDSDGCNGADFHKLSLPFVFSLLTCFIMVHSLL